MSSTDAQPACRPDFDINELDYALPEELIAQHPPEERGRSRLLVVDRAKQTIEDSTVENLANSLQAGDTLVMNNTRVVPAKFRLKRSTGGIIDAMFLDEPEPGVWEVLLKGAQRVAIDETLTIDHPGNSDGDKRIALVARARGERGMWRLQLCADKPESATHILERVGRMPLPPYIKRGKGSDDYDPEDWERYQTIYADSPGAVAAPTAGLHFTQPLLKRISEANVATHFVTLHVGYGTFAPVEVSNLADHKMHYERFDISRDTCDAITQTREQGGRIVAVGTTSARVLESAWRANGLTEGISGSTDLFCYPPYSFGGFDALMTNFHLPKSTLLALVMAFGGIDLIRSAYQQAVAERYHFFSYGDAMLIV
ncbi:MAG: S-adenosylmethionine:tRNA ribosyltransferase-isomerase [Phycisphaerae bacterium]|nr:MAG: S-adenosylmethionine:tRNA ribosyltransferase-isomerase [Phycisphaerae bacterium]